MSDNYNGWSNYETWNVNLWLSNDEGLYNLVTEMVRDEFDRGKLSNNYNFASRIEFFVRDIAGEDTHFGDLTYSDLSAVDWDEIANAWMEG